MRKIGLSADELVAALLYLSEEETVCLLESCGVRHLGSHLLIAGINPKEIREVTNDDPNQTLAFLDEKLSGEQAAIFTLSYDFGLKLESIPSNHKTLEPDVFLALFDCLIVHDYDSGETYITGDQTGFAAIEAKLRDVTFAESQSVAKAAFATSNFTKNTYLSAVEKIKELIRCGNTYQTNLT
ncbi:MAG: hypothetical protein ACRD43_10280, partial [Pyrinomonadaceae bacterium]